MHWHMLNLSTQLPAKTPQIRGESEFRRMQAMLLLTDINSTILRPLATVPAAELAVW
jgi:hypothetical protein